MSDSDRENTDIYTGDTSSISPENLSYMYEALNEAGSAAEIGEVPIGAVVVQAGKIIGRGYNRRETDRDVTAHAEILAIRAAARHLGTWRLNDCDLYVTLEPCHMCAAAGVQARIRHIYFAAADPKGGAIFSVDNYLDNAATFHSVRWTGGLLATESSELLQDFFRLLRERNKNIDRSLGSKGARLRWRKGEDTNREAP